MTSLRVTGLNPDLGPGADVVTIFTPLGIRFWDTSRDVAVTDALEVVAWPPSQPERKRAAVRSLSGIYAFHGLPGMRDVEYPEDPDALQLSPPVQRRFVVSVSDARRRFLPVVFSVDLPQFGIYPSSTVPPGGPPIPGLYLFSSPTRPAGALAVVRAQLAEDATGTPAAHAVVEVEAPQGQLFHGIADENGSVAVMFSYPRFRTGATSSPPGVAEAPGTQTWPLTVRVRYSPFLQTPVQGSKLPDLRSILGQSDARLQATTSTSSLTNEISAELEFGRELILRTLGLPYLVVGAAVSPP
jgi:hypothetical protein